MIPILAETLCVTPCSLYLTEWWISDKAKCHSSYRHAACWKGRHDEVRGFSVDAVLTKFKLSKMSRNIKKTKKRTTRIMKIKQCVTFNPDVRDLRRACHKHYGAVSFYWSYRWIFRLGESSGFVYRRWRRQNCASQREFGDCRISFMTQARELKMAMQVKLL